VNFIREEISMTDEFELPELTDVDLKLIAEMLPTYPPLAPMGDISIKEMRPELSERELEIVYKHYKALGGTMRKK